MAFGYKAEYGYYIDPNGLAHGVVTTLDGVNLNDCVITDRNTRFYIPEAKYVVSPNSNTYSQDRTAKGKQFRDEITTTNYHGLPDWRYFSLLPGQPSVSTINDQDWFQYTYWWVCQLPLLSNYDPFTIENVAKKGNPFFYCPNLARAMYPQLHGKVAKTFVYFPTWHKLMDQDGRLYTVGSTGLITQAIAGGKYWHNSVTPDGISSGSAHCNWYGNYIIYNETTAAYTCMEYQISGYAGGQYSWIVWDDDNAVLNNNFFVGFFGFANGNYDFKSDIGGDPDPYSQVGEKSKTGGGNGTGVIPGISPTPYPGAANLVDVTSFINVYCPSASDLLDLANEIWAPNVVELIKGMTLQPMDSVISFHIMPWPGTISSGKDYIKLGFYTSSTAQAHYPIGQYYEHDCGTIHIDEIWGSYLDYKCRFSLFLPFIGSIPLQPEDVVGKDITVKYMMNILTGSVVAYVIRDDAVIANFGGNASFQVPLTGADKSNLISGIIGVAGTAITGIASGGMTAPVAAGIASSSLNTAMSKTTYQKAGGLGANTAYMGIRTPYLTVYVPNMCLPDDQNGFIGYPSYITDTLGNQRGYTEVYKSHIHASGASEEELIEIENLLSSGVIIA